MENEKVKNEKVNCEELKKFIVDDLKMPIARIGRKAGIDSENSRNSFSNRLLRRSAFSIDEYVRVCQELRVPFDRFLNA